MAEREYASTRSTNLTDRYRVRRRRQSRKREYMRKTNFQPISTTAAEIIDSIFSISPSVSACGRNGFGLVFVLPTTFYIYFGNSIYNRHRDAYDVFRISTLIYSSFLLFSHSSLFLFANQYFYWSGTKLRCLFMFNNGKQLCVWLPHTYTHTQPHALLPAPNKAKRKKNRP